VAILTLIHKREYLANHGTRCPFCKSKEIEADQGEWGEGYASQPVRCLNPDCEETWNDVYTLTDVDTDDENDAAVKEPLCKVIDKRPRTK